MARPTSRTTHALRQAADSWSLVNDVDDTSVTPRVLVVDGTNLANVCRPTPGAAAFRQPLRERFAAWLAFLAAVAAGDLVLVAFDNKGSSLTNVRAQLAPSYLAGRYQAAAAAGGADVQLSGWAELAGVVEELQQQQQQQQQQQADHHQQDSRAHGAAPAGSNSGSGRAAGPCCFLGCQAAYGFEADDVLGAAATWCRSQLAPPPHVVVASSDSDMLQLMDAHTSWLELLQVPTAQQPSGLLLHTAAAFEQQRGFPPAAWPDFLALTGKQEAGLRSAGVTARLAKTLLRRFGSIDGILASRDALKPYGAAHKLLGAGQPGSDARCDTAARNLAVLRLRPEQQQLPEERLRTCYAAATAAAERRHHAQEQRHQQQEGRAAAAASLLHPARQLHMRQGQPYLDVLQQGLHELGLSQQIAHHTSAAGLWCDLVVRVGGAGAAAAASASSAASKPEESAGAAGQAGCAGPPPPAAAAAGGASAVGPGWAAFHILTPGELSSGGTPASSGCEEAADALAEQLRDSCGCWAAGTSALGHPKRALLRAATGGAKRHLALLKGMGMPVVVVPFFELLLLGPRAAAGGSGGAASGVLLSYLQAVLREHGLVGGGFDAQGDP